MKKIYSFMLLFVCAMITFAQTVVQGVPRSGEISLAAEATSDGSVVVKDSINYWVGEGRKWSALVIKFNDGTNNAYVWGYRWNGSATGEDMFRAVAAADPRLLLLTQQTNYNGTVAGIGYYPNGRSNSNVYFDLSGAMSDSNINFRYYSTQTPPSANMGQTSYPGDSTTLLARNAIANGKRTGIIQHPFDHAHYGYSAYDYDHWKDSCSTGIWRAAWYDGYWSYWVKGMNDSNYSYSGLGFSNRNLANGSVDGWSYVSDMTNWYSADMSNANLIYVSSVSTATARAKRFLEENASSANVYTVSTMAELSTLLASNDFVAGSTVRFSDDVKGTTLKCDKYIEIKKDVIIDGNGIIITGDDDIFYNYSGATVAFRNVIFQGITGTALYCCDSNTSVENCTFESINVSGNHVIEVEQDGTDDMVFNLVGCVISNNSTSNDCPIIRIKGCATKTKHNFIVNVASCTFVGNNPVDSKKVLYFANYPTVNFANNVFENNVGDAISISTSKEIIQDYMKSAGYNVIKGTVNENVVTAETDVVDANIDDNLMLDEGVYKVVSTGKAYNNLPANTAIEGVTFPVTDITGAVIDYTNATHSGACQSVYGAATAISNVPETENTDGCVVYGIDGVRLNSALVNGGLYKKGKTVNGKQVYIKVK